MPYLSERPAFFTAARYPWHWGAALTNIGILALSIIYRLQQRRMSAEKMQLVLADRQKEAELRYLRTQINPHFLFNVLNNIYSMARTGNEKTAATVLKLSNLLRYVTYEGVQTQVLLEQELKQLQEYML